MLVDFLELYSRVSSPSSIEISEVKDLCGGDGAGWMYTELAGQKRLPYHCLVRPATVWKILGMLSAV